MVPGSLKKRVSGWELFFRLFRQLEPEEVSSRFLTVPNMITALGIAVTIGYISCFVLGITEAFIPLLVTAAGFSDFIDGAAARMLNQHSRLGKILDPFRDRLLGAAMLGNILLREPKFLPLGMAIIGIEIIIAGNHEYHLLTAGNIFWEKMHVSGKVRQVIHLAAGGVFVYQAYAARYWNEWAGIPFMSTAAIMVVIFWGSAWRAVMLLMEPKISTSH